MNGVTVGEVTAFVGPLVAFIGLMGGLIAWIMTRTSRYVQNQITQVQIITNERIANLTAQLIEQGKTLEVLTKESRDTALAVARIEGGLSQTSGKQQN